MTFCSQVVDSILTETADLSEEEVLKRSQLLEHYMINFLMFGRIVFNPTFETWSLRVLL